MPVLCHLLPRTESFIVAHVCSKSPRIRTIAVKVWSFPGQIWPIPCEMWLRRARALKRASGQHGPTANGRCALAIWRRSWSSVPGMVPRSSSRISPRLQACVCMSCGHGPMPRHLKDVLPPKERSKARLRFRQRRGAQGSDVDETLPSAWFRFWRRSWFGG